MALLSGPLFTNRNLIQDDRTIRREIPPKVAPIEFLLMLSSDMPILIDVET